MTFYDVIVVGGGPTGSYTAGKLSAAGHRVLVLERRRRAGDAVCCTGIIGQECVTSFNIEDSVILRRVKSARIFSPSGNEISLHRETTQACILDRAAFDGAMAARAQEAGAEYEFESPVKSVAIERDNVRVEACCRGRDRQIRAKAVVIANGFRSRQCRELGAGLPGDHTVGVQADVKAVGLEEVEVYFGNDTAPGFFAWLVPTVPPLARAGLMTRKNPGLYLRKWLAQLAARDVIASPDVPIRYGGIPLKPLSRTCGERWVAIGDAAGQVKPTSGGGIYYGLIGADIAAGTLHQALLDGDLSAGRLMRYHRGWRRKLGRELRVGYWARKLFERLNDRRVDRIFEMVKDNGIDKSLLDAEDLSFDWHSRTLLRLLGYRMVSRALDVIKLPFRSA